MWLILCLNNTTSHYTWLTRDMTYSFVWHKSLICVTWLIHNVTWPIHTCDMTHPYMWPDSLTHATWLIHVCDMTCSYMRRDSFICVTWLIHVWHDSPMTWLIHVWDMTHSCVWHVSFICVTWLTHDMTHSCVWHDSFMCVTCLIQDLAHSCVCQSLFYANASFCCTGWRRRIGCLIFIGHLKEPFN